MILVVDVGGCVSTRGPLINDVDIIFSRYSGVYYDPFLAAQAAQAAQMQAASSLQMNPVSGPPTQSLTLYTQPPHPLHTNLLTPSNTSAVLLLPPRRLTQYTVNPLSPSVATEQHFVSSQTK